MPATATKKTRTLSYNAVVGCLHIRQDGKEKGYWLDRLEHDMGQGFTCVRLTKIARTKAGDGEQPYDVVVGPDGESCECLGWLKWNHCKHTAAVRCLVARGSL